MRFPDAINIRRVPEYTGIKRVLIIEETLTHYRVPLYSDMRARLSQLGVHMDVVHGDRVERGLSRSDGGSISWAKRIRNRGVFLSSRPLVWQPVLPMALRYDLVIVNHGSRLVVNYLLLLIQVLGGPKVAFFGHGHNLQKRSDYSFKFAELAKRQYTRLAFWCFAYSEASRDRFSSIGVNRERISVVNNAIDTSGVIEVRRELEGVSSESPSPVNTRCLYLGSLYAEKDPLFLIEVGKLILREVPSFSLDVVGSGSLLDELTNLAKDHPWLRVHGALTGREKHMLGCQAQLLLVPKLAGLVVLDSFALEAPLVTLADAGHGPEIEYLESGINGWLVDPKDDATAAYANAVVSLLKAPELVSALRSGCKESSVRYSIHEMSNRYCAGILSALKVGRS